MLTFNENEDVGSVVPIIIVPGLAFVPDTVGVPVTVNVTEAPAAIVAGSV